MPKRSRSHNQAQHRNKKRRRTKQNYAAPTFSSTVGAIDRTPVNSIFPKCLTTTLTYSSSASGSLSGSVCSITYRMNGLYDPLVATGGHQPRGFDELMQIYKRFVVHSVEVSLRPYGLSTSKPCLIFIHASKEQSPPEYVAESPATVTRAVAGGYSAYPGLCKAKFSVRQLSGKNPFEHEPLQGTVSADPVEQFYLIFGATSPNTSSVATDQFPKFDIQIHYRASFFEAKDIDHS